MSDTGGPEDPEVARLREQLAAAERAAELRAELEAAQADLEAAQAEISAAERKAHLQRVSAKRAERLTAAAAEGEARRLRQEQAAQEAAEERVAEAKRVRQEQADRKAERRANRANRKADQLREEAAQVEEFKPLTLGETIAIGIKINESKTTEAAQHWPSLSSSPVLSDEERAAQQAERQRKRADRAAKWDAKAAVETPNESGTPFEESRETPGISDHSVGTNQPSLRKGVLTLLAIGVVVVLILFAAGTTKDRFDVQCDVNPAHTAVAVLVRYDQAKEPISSQPGANRSRVEINFGDGTSEIKYVNFYEANKSSTWFRHSYDSPGTYKIKVDLGALGLKQLSESCTIALLRQAND